jgi:hypothetical protein
MHSLRYVIAHYRRIPSLAALPIHHRVVHPHPLHVGKSDKESRGVQAEAEEEDYDSDTHIAVRGCTRPAPSSHH